MEIDLKESTVAVLDRDGKIIGTGFIVDGNSILTCAHVVGEANSAPGQNVDIRFYVNGLQTSTLVDFQRWSPVDQKDLALLRVEKMPQQAVALPLGFSADSIGNDFRAFGYAKVGAVQGIAAQGKIVDLVEKGRLIQLSSQEIDRGMSGGPVLDTLHGQVIGMILWGKPSTLGDRNAYTTFAVNVETILEICPELSVSKGMPKQNSVFVDLTPPPAAKFLDREDQISALCKYVYQSDTPMIVLVGPGGIGKSALLADLCQKIESRHPAAIADKAIYKTCDVAKDQPLQLFSEILDQLLDDAERDELQARRDRSDARIEKISDDLVSALCGRRYLAVLDNFELLLNPGGALKYPEHVKFFEKFLGCHCGLRILIASRKTIKLPLRLQSPSIVTLTVSEGLPEADAISLMREEGQGQFDDTDAETLSRAAQSVSGYPLYLGWIAQLLEHQSRKDVKAILEGKEFKDAVADLTGAYHDLLEDDQLQVVRALSILTRAEDLAAIGYVLGGTKTDDRIFSILKDLRSDGFVQLMKDRYDLHQATRQYIYERIPTTGEHSRSELHARAAEYYNGLLSDSVSSDDPESVTCMGWYRNENDKWQGAVSEWISHLACSGDNDQACLSIVRLYFQGFWWWGNYLPFRLCERIVNILKDTRLENSLFLSDLQKCLESFHQAWVLASLKERTQDQERWKTSLRSLQELLRMTKCDGRWQDFGEYAERLETRLIIDTYLGEASYYLGCPEGEFRAYYDEAYEIADTLDDLKWTMGYISFYLGDWWLARGRAREALEIALTAHKDAEEYDDGDYEVLADIFRLLGDVYWELDERAKSCSAYQLAGFFAYRFQGYPHPPDFYNATFYVEITERTLEKVYLYWKNDHEKALGFCEALHTFWQPYWETVPPVAGQPGRDELSAWLSSRDSDSLNKYLYPPAPLLLDVRQVCQAEDSAYAEVSNKVCEMMEDAVQALIAKVI